MTNVTETLFAMVAENNRKRQIKEALIDFVGLVVVFGVLFYFVK